MSVAKRMKPTHLRKNLYQVLDEILRTGQAVEIDRNGRTLRIEPVAKASRLSRLTPHPEAVTGDLDTIDDIRWEDYWKP